MRKLLLIQTFLRLCKAYAIHPTPEQMDNLSDNVDWYMDSCEAYGWEPNIKGMLLFFRQINQKVREGIINGAC